MYHYCLTSFYHFYCLEGNRGLLPTSKMAGVLCDNSKQLEAIVYNYCLNQGIPSQMWKGS